MLILKYINRTNQYFELFNIFKMKKTLLCLFLCSFFCLNAQDTPHLVLIDSFENQVDIYKENNHILTSFHNSFTEKDSLMVIKFQKQVEDFGDIQQHRCPTGEWVEKRRNELLEEQNKIMDFEASITKADSLLYTELKNWADNYVEKEIRFYAHSKNIALFVLREKPLYWDDTSRNLGKEIVAFINQSVWKEAYQHFVIFIKNKIIFDLKLD